jgi:WD40 repeat protein
MKAMLKYLTTLIIGLLAMPPSVSKPQSAIVINQKTGTEISFATFSPNGRWLLITGEGGSELWDLKGAVPVRRWSDPNGGGSASFDSESRRFVIAEYANSTHPSSQALSVWSISHLWRSWHPPNNQFNEPAVVRFGATNGSIFIADGSKKSRLLDTVNGTSLTLEVKDSVADASFNQTGELLGVATQHGITVLRTPFYSGSERRTLPVDFTSRISFSFDDKWLATVGDDDTIRIWDTGQWKVAKEFPGKQTSALHFFHHSNCLLTSDADGRVVVWDVEQSEIVFRLQVSLAYDISPSDTFLVTAAPQSVLPLLRDISVIKARCGKSTPR